MKKYRYNRVKIAIELTHNPNGWRWVVEHMLLAQVISKEPESDKESKCTCDGTQNDSYCDKHGMFADKPKIEPLNLIDTKTSRNELRDTEKEIMIENKINELIDVINHLNK